MTLNVVLTIVGAAAGVVGAVAAVVAVFEPGMREAKAGAKNFGPALAKLQETITLIEPKIEELNRMNQQCHANYSEGQIRLFNQQLEKGKELVNTCNAIPGMDKKKKRKYAKMLAEVDSSLRDSLVLLWKN